MSERGVVFAFAVALIMFVIRLLVIVIVRVAK